MPCTFFHFILKCCLLYSHWSNWALLHLLRFKRLDTRQDVFSFTFAFVSYNTGLILAKSFSKNSKLKTLLDVCLRLKVVSGSLQEGRSTRYPSIYWNPWSVKELIINISNCRVQEKINADYKINLLLSLPPVSGSTLLPITLSISTVSGASSSTKIIISKNYRLRQNCF